MIGAGLKQLPDERIVCTNAGILRYRPANRYWVDYNYKRVSIHSTTHCYCCVGSHPTDVYASCL